MSDDHVVGHPADEESLETDAAFDTGAAEEVSLHPGRWRLRLWHKLLIGFGALVVLLVALGAVLYFFGGMSGSVYDPQIEQQYQQMAAAGQAPPVEKGFVVPIPGCRCHSTDPVLTQQHRARRMYMCAKCHGGR